MAQSERKPRRCAIYTRKSSEEGLEQSFNSLHAQREACEAFVKSQAHEGWATLPEQYDDGGFSGGNTERPALARLLGQIHRGEVDVVVVYKVDRLSRSLADFVRLIELFDRTNVSFVSVTQQFNTSTSMGRLTLNVLLSFAQFEREVTSERIRDKIAASKKKGMWMGGLVPLGYDRVDKRLVVNDKEAATVRHIYSRYLVLGCVRALKAELDANGYRTRARPEHHKVSGNKPFSRGALYTILKNPIYIAKVHHNGELHDGMHGAILDSQLWEAAREKLARNRLESLSKARVKHPTLLAGLVYDDKGNRMSPTSSRRKNRRYPYYISQAVLQYREDEAGSVIRIPGKALEGIVVNQLFDLLKSPGRLLDLLHEYRLSGAVTEKAIQAAADLADEWPGMKPHDQIALMKEWVSRIVVGKSKVDITVRSGQLCQRLTGLASAAADRDDEKSRRELCLSAGVKLRRSGIESKLVYPSGPPVQTHKRSVKALQEALLKSLEWNEALLNGEVRSIEALMERDNLNPRQTHRLRKLAFLAPDIMEAVIAGDVPETLTLERLKQGFPLDWNAQRTHFGITPPRH